MTEMAFSHPPLAGTARLFLREPDLTGIGRLAVTDHYAILGGISVRWLGLNDDLVCSGLEAADLIRSVDDGRFQGVCIYDSAHARTPPSGGLTVPRMEPSRREEKPNNPAARAVTIAIRNEVNFIIWCFWKFTKRSCQPSCTPHSTRLPCSSRKYLSIDAVTPPGSG